MHKDSDGCLKILDAGCGTGYTLKELSAYGTTFGIDFSMDAIALTQKRDLGYIQRASTEHLPFKDDSFDWVFSLDNLEHIQNDQAAVDELKRVCKPQGFLMIAVPAHPFLWSGEDVVSHHERRYERYSFKKLIEGADLRIIKFTHFNFLLLPLISFVIFKKRFFGQFSSNVKQFPIWLNNLLRSIFEFEKYILHRINMPFGLSIMCLAQKK